MAPGGGYTSLGLVYEVCTMLGLLHVTEFFALPPAEQDLWLGHAMNTVGASYTRRTGRGRATIDAAHHRDTLAAIRAARGEG